METASLTGNKELIKQKCQNHVVLDFAKAGKRGSWPSQEYTLFGQPESKTLKERQH